MRNYKVAVISEQEAIEKGYFCGGVSRDKFLKAVTKHNSDVRIIYGETHAALFDKVKGFICGVSRNFTIPLFTIHNTTTNKVMCRSWKALIKILRSKGYEIHEKDLY